MSQAELRKHIEETRALISSPQALRKALSSENSQAKKLQSQIEDVEL